jgi:predicted glycoside hydrolase/deacetylase ChbG (UPF0249 family)
MLLIINADDLGVSESVNNETFALMQSGLITSATLIANAPAFEDAVRNSKKFPHCSFGVHLNLSVFPPLSRSKYLEAALCGGQLCRETLRKHLSVELRSAMEQELMMQVQRVVDAGIPVSHFDSHHFMHASSEVFPMLKAVQKRFGVRKLRSTVQVLSPQQMSRSEVLKNKLLNVAHRRWYRTLTPDGWCSFHCFHAALFKKEPPQLGSLELMVHPGTDDTGYAQEIGLLRSHWQETLPPNAALGSYHLL